MLGAVYAGLQLATMLACVGAANALANPRRLLRAVPGALYEVGVAVVVALSFSPQLVEGVSRVRAARRLRGRPHTGLRGLRGVAMPVLEGALERSVDLAAAMDARGFGRGAADAGRAPTLRRADPGGLLGVCAGLYGLLDADSPRRSACRCSPSGPPWPPPGSPSAAAARPAPATGPTSGAPGVAGLAAAALVAAVGVLDRCRARPGRAGAVDLAAGRADAARRADPRRCWSPCCPPGSRRRRDATPRPPTATARRTPARVEEPV